MSFRVTGFLRRMVQKVLANFLLFSILIGQISFIALWLPKTAEAAEVVVTTLANQNATSHHVAGSQIVFISDQVGYVFYRAQPTSGPCVYQKTTDGGASWGLQITVDAQTDCIGISVWYDQWTPGDTGNYIHILTMEDGSAQDRLFYNRLDTTNDTRWLGTAPVVISTGQVPTLVRGSNTPNISKATDGRLFATVSDTSDSFVVACPSSNNCSTTSGWSEITGATLTNADNWSIIMPLSAGSIILINQNIGTNLLRSNVWNGSWSGWTNIDTAIVENTTYDVSFAATVDPATGDILLAYVSDNDNFTTADHDIRTARYSGGVWSPTNNVLTNVPSRGLHNVAISIDTNRSTVYVAYSIRSAIANAATGNVYFATSTTAMTSWGAEQGPLSTVSGNLYGFNMNLMSNERIYATWYDATVAQRIRGVTVADISPDVRVSATGTVNTLVRGGETSKYLGGTFAITELLGSRNLTNITFSENGTIDAGADLDNVLLRYEYDTSLPYNCASESYSGSESQFGDTLINGFSGPNGFASFNDNLSISTTSALCLYLVMDVSDDANDGDTISFSIDSPQSDVVLSGSPVIDPDTPVTLNASTTVVNDTSTLSSYHWRNDDGSESGATSATGGVADTPLSSLPQLSPKRLRLAVSNEGSTTTPSLALRLEYGPLVTTCSDITSWEVVGTSSAHFSMFNTANLSNGNNTTDIAVGSGGVANPNPSFLSSNGGQLDATSTAGAISLSPTQFVELEYSIEATNNSVEGNSYCFRVTNNGAPLENYLSYPSLTVSADVSLLTNGTMIATTTIPNTNVYMGGVFAVRENVSSRTVTNMTIAENGTVNAQTGLENIRLYYEYDTSNPYNCASESFNGTEAQYGATTTFSGANGTASFSGTASINTGQTACFYVVLDVNEIANTNQTVAISMPNGGGDVILSAGSISPSTEVALNASTTLLGSSLNQFGYHWRADNGTEVTATSLTGGLQNTLLSDYALATPLRLRLGVHNDGNATSPNRALQLQYGIKVTTCSAISVWSNVATGSDWELYNSPNLTHGNDTTNISTATGGLSDIGGKSFATPNSGIRETESKTATTTYANSEFYEYEFSIQASTTASYDTGYCFRLIKTDNTTINTYSFYPEVQTAPKRDFKIQRGFTNVTGTSTVVSAGVSYVAPASTSSAFVRIVNTHHTGSGRSTVSNVFNASDVTAVISNSSNLTSNFTIGRPAGALNDTRVYWEIVEFIGLPDTDNEIEIKAVGTVAMNQPALTATGTPVTVSDDSKVVVYITGVTNSNASRNLYYAGQVTSAWNSSTNQPIFTRGAAGTANLVISYAVVEFTGANWNIQRVEHNYTAVGVTETKSINPVNSLSRTFTHIQKRMTAQGNVQNFGHEVWLSSIGAVSFLLDSTATVPSGHTSVAWVIENMQISNGKMVVNRYADSTTGGTAPLNIVDTITEVDAMNNTSVIAVSRAAGVNTSFPRPMAGIELASTTAYNIWRNNSGSLLHFRTEVVEWPTQGLAIRQHYYRIYTNNDELLPNDPWPPGLADLGENTTLTEFDEPIGLGDSVRLRMTVRADNANWPAGLHQFKLQYGVRATTCSAISAWNEVGDTASSTIWRLADVASSSDGTPLSVNPPDPGDLLISVADVAGVLTEAETSVVNPYTAVVGDYVEFDWPLQHNGALQRTTYCFRMAYANNDPIDGYFYYPQIRTAGFTPAVTEWRWYDDAENETPTSALAGSNIAPTEIVNQNLITLRVVLDELKNVTGNNARFYLQYDESPSFSNPQNVTASSSCTEFSRWCYATVGVGDNATITTALLASSDSCVASIGNGCGTHGTSPTNITGFTHAPGTSREYAFYIESRTAKVGAVYYFRLVENTDDIPVRLNTGASHPSLVTESARLTLTINGLGSGTTTAGIVTGATTTPTTVGFDLNIFDVPVHAAHRINIDTNASEGYRVYMSTDSPLISSHGGEIQNVTGINTSPTSWATGCSLSATSCVGYHTTDATLSGVSSRFAPDDTFSGFSTGLDEVMYSPVPIDDTHDIVYKILVRALQPAGEYSTNITFIATPVY